MFQCRPVRIKTLARLTLKPGAKIAPLPLLSSKKYLDKCAKGPNRCVFNAPLTLIFSSILSLSSSPVLHASSILGTEAESLLTYCPPINVSKIEPAGLAQVTVLTSLQSSNKFLSSSTMSSVRQRSSQKEKGLSSSPPQSRNGDIDSIIKASNLPEKVTSEWDYKTALVIITSIAFVTRFWGIGHPNEVVFDEVHFGKVRQMLQLQIEIRFVSLWSFI